MSKGIIAKFLNWLEKTKYNMQRNGLAIVEIKKSSDNTSVYVDIMSNLYFSSITLWETGDVLFEQLLIESEETIYCESLIINDENYNKICSDFIKRIMK